MQEEKPNREYPPIKKGEIFVPEEAIREVLKVSKEERRSKLAEFKEKLKYQQEGLAKVQAEMIEKIRENPDMSFNEMFELFLSKAAPYGANEDQEEKARIALEKYENSRREIVDWCEYNTTGTESFFELFKKKPQGEVEQSPDLLSLNLRCHDADDFAYIFFLGYRINHPGARFEESLRQKAIHYKGVNLTLPGSKFSITAENVTETLKQDDPDAFSDEVFRHEEQHSFYELFNEEVEMNDCLKNSVLEKIKRANSEGEKFDLLKKYLREVRKIAEEKSKDEILAFYKDGTAKEIVCEKLTRKKKKEGGSYDFVANEKGWRILNEKNEDLQPLFEKAKQVVFEEEYMEVLQNAFSAIEKMENDGYGKEEIIALFTHEPLAKWEKVAGRVLEK